MSVLKCKFCDSTLIQYPGMDSGSGAEGPNGDLSLCYNIYHCEHCMSLAIEHLWNLAGVYWVMQQGIPCVEVYADEIALAAFEWYDAISSLNSTPYTKSEIHRLTNAEKRLRLAVENK